MKHAQLISEIYDAVAEPRRWTAVLDRVCEATGCHGAVILDLADDGSGAVKDWSRHSSSLLYDQLARFHGRFREHETAIHKRIGDNTDKFDALEIITNDRYRFETDVYGRDARDRVLLDQNIEEVTAVLLDKDNRDRSRITLAYPVGHGAPTPEEREVIQAIIPHLAKACSLSQAFARRTEERDMLASAFKRMKVGACLLDEDGRIVLTNPEFKRQVEAYGAFGPDRRGRLRIAQDEDQAQMHKMISDVSAHGRYGGRPRKEAIVTGDLGSGAALCVELAPLERAEGIGSKRFRGSVMFSLDASRPLDLDTGPLQRAFGLTPAETALAGMLAEGMTNQEIAERRGRSADTVNAQVKSVLSKTGASNRTQFARLAVNFGARLVQTDD